MVFLRFIEDDEGIDEGAAAHVGERCDLDMLLLDPRLQLALGEHVLQRVVKRSQIRVDFLLKIAREKTQALPSLHRRSR